MKSLVRGALFWGCAAIFFGSLTPRTALAQDRKSELALVVGVVIDGLPAWQVEENKARFTGGFARLLSAGAYFTHAAYGHAATFTAPGHATLVTGQDPARHGIIGNQWFDRGTGRRMDSGADPRHHVLGEPELSYASTSPVGLREPALGDLLKEATHDKARVFAVTGKDRSAVMMAGRAGVAYFYTPVAGRFVTTDYYMKEYPSWWRDFYTQRPQDHWLGAVWQSEIQNGDAVESTPPFAQLPKLTWGQSTAGSDYLFKLSQTPFVEEYQWQFVQRLIEAESLGKNSWGVTDLLWIGLSVHDAINHVQGPTSDRSRDNLLRLDKLLGKMLTEFDARFGREAYLLVVTSDHGFTPAPELCREGDGMGGRLDPQQLQQAIDAGLSLKYGKGRYVESWQTPAFYLDVKTLQEKGIKPEIAQKIAVDVLASFPGIERAFSRSVLLRAEKNNDFFWNSALRSFDSERSGDVILIPKKCWYLLGAPHLLAATHGTPHDFDRHVPLWLWGRHVKPGEYSDDVDMTEVMPALAAQAGLSVERKAKNPVLLALGADAH